MDDSNTTYVFPARAGMNRDHPPTPTPNGGVPRMCGDEPGFLYGLSEVSACSPHVRG